MGRPSPPTMLYQRNLSEEPHVKGGIQRVSGLSLTLQMAGGAYFTPPLKKNFVLALTMPAILFQRLKMAIAFLLSAGPKIES